MEGTARRLLLARRRRYPHCFPFQASAGVCMTLRQYPVVFSSVRVRLVTRDSTAWVPHRAVPADVLDRAARRSDSIGHPGLHPSAAAAISGPKLRINKRLQSLQIGLRLLLWPPHRDPRGPDPRWPEGRQPFQMWSPCESTLPCSKTRTCTCLWRGSSRSSPMKSQQNTFNAERSTTYNSCVTTSDFGVSSSIGSWASLYVSNGSWHPPLSRPTCAFQVTSMVLRPISKPPSPMIPAV